MSCEAVNCGTVSMAVVILVATALYIICIKWLGLWTPSLPSRRRKPAPDPIVGYLLTVLRYPGETYETFVVESIHRWVGIEKSLGRSGTILYSHPLTADERDFILICDTEYKRNKFTLLALSNRDGSCFALSYDKEISQINGSVFDFTVQADSILDGSWKLAEPEIEECTTDEEKVFDRALNEHEHKKSSPREAH